MVEEMDLLHQGQQAQGPSEAVNVDDVPMSSHHLNTISLGRFPLTSQSEKAQQATTKHRREKSSQMTHNGGGSGSSGVSLALGLHQNEGHELSQPSCNHLVPFQPCNGCCDGFDRRI